MNSKLKKRTKIALGLIPVYVIVLVLIGSLIYLSISYKPMTEALDAMESTSEITVVDGKKWISFTPTENASTTGFIFYPGGNVEPESYSIIARNIALKGFPVFLVKMPFDLAIFAPNRGGEIIEAHSEITDWIIGGHSLGGAMSVRSVYDSSDLFSGLVLLAAYPDDSNNISSYDIPVITIYGTEDGILSKPISDTLDLLPANTTVLEIVGGNHAYFGSYGDQKGDNVATITRADQQNQTVITITNFLLSI
ncbi:MAG: alpha/beta hydrolase [Asgard group archaeon]|nr:alpha/beta hydrolase [Asgard group archaeon]